MKLYNITNDNISHFFDTVSHCNGKIELVTDEGDRLNLKSKLSQYVALAKLFDETGIPEMELVCYDPKDVENLIQFMTN